MFLDVGDGHKVYFEEFGNREGSKILFLHGGPGLGFSDADKSFFCPNQHYVLFIDQRGCGKSIPKGSLKHNTTEHLLSDIDMLLDHLSIDSVILFGGSWGATLAVLYAARSPHRVSQMILRGFFPATKKCIDIYLRGEIQRTHPDHWEEVTSRVPPHMKGKEAEFIFNAIGRGTKGMESLARTWATYGFSLSRKSFDAGEVDQIMNQTEIDLDRIKIELHYALSAFFIPENYVYQQAKEIKNIPTTIIHGKYDYLCPIEYAERLFKILPHSKLIVVDAGHSVAEKEIIEEIFVALKGI